MNRRKRTEILIKSDEKLAMQLANEIRNKYKVKEIEDSNHGLVMIKIRETAKRELFYLGEVLVSEAKIYIDGALGIGIVAGDREELASNLAVIDAAYKRGLQEVETWEEVLLEAEEKIKYIESMEEAKILETKVDFSTMDI
ncbi:phosphonate C-P lyase system protein PhnG [Clostridium paraputrificum]|uniref:phosphonate C-P lyase system protein PhnG n=1 Tax=Clostridium TaxID=1485 RepID=UPI003D32D500